MKRSPKKKNTNKNRNKDLPQLTPHESPSVTMRPTGSIKIVERPEEWSEKSMLDAWVSNSDFNRKKEPQIRASGVVEKEITPGYGNTV